MNREFRAPLFSIFRRGLIGNTLTACWLMASAFVVGYSVGGMFPSYLQKDLGLPTGMVALPIMLQSLMFFCRRCCGASSPIALAGGGH